MAITLEKKKPISLIKEKPGLQNILAGLGWDEATINGHKVDCDVSVFMLGANGKLPQDEFFIFYNNRLLFGYAADYYSVFSLPPGIFCC